MQRLETRRQTKDGRLIDVSVTASPIKDSSGMVIGASKVARNISERIRGDEALRREHDRAQQYLDTAGVILLALDMQGRITLVNRYACSTFGWTSEELIGRDFIDVCVPERIRRDTREKLKTVHAGDDAIVDNPIVTRSGEERLVEWRTTFLRDDAGHIVGTLSSGADVTEHRRAESAVRDERDRAQRYLDTAEVILLALDVEGRITSINRKGCDLLGWTERELVGRDWFDMCLAPQERVGVRERFGNLIRGDVSISENTVDSSECSLVKNTNLVSLMIGRLMPSARHTQAATIARLNRNLRPPRVMREDSWFGPGHASGEQASSRR